MMKRLVVVMIVLMSVVSAFAEMKLAFVNSEKIMAEYTEAGKVRDELTKWNKEKEGEAIKMEQEIKQLEDELKNMSVMISEDKKKEKMAYGQQKMQEYYAFKEKTWGQQGEFYREQNKLMQPVITKVQAAITTVSEADGYDFVFDATTGTLVHAKLEYDISDKVIIELNK